MNTVRRHLIVGQPDGPSLSPAQRRFNQLLQKIDKARGLLQAWEENAPLFAAGFAARVLPVQAELDQLQAQLIRRLQALLDTPAAVIIAPTASQPAKAGAITKPGKAARATADWSRAERRRLAQDLCDLAAGMIEGTRDEALQAEMQALFKRHAGHGYDEEKADEMAAMKSMLESISGLDLGEEMPQTEEELLRAAQQALSDQHEARAQQRARRKPTAAERRREREQAEATQSLREVYRKLAAALHPDRAEDAVDLERRNALMPRVNQAYEAGDLLALFALQLEIEQVDADHLARATAARAQQYNRLLAEQLAQLEAAIDARRINLCLDHGLEPDRLRQPAQLGPLLEQAAAEMRAARVGMQRELVRLEDPIKARAAVRARWRQEDQAPHHGLF